MSNSARRKIVEMYGRIAELERQNAELVKALKDARQHIMEWWEQESQELPPARSPEFVGRLDALIAEAGK